jgi:hypothetical protein
MMTPAALLSMVETNGSSPTLQVKRLLPTTTSPQDVLSKYGDIDWAVEYMFARKRIMERNKVILIAGFI